MAKPKMHTDFLSAVKKQTRQHPFSLLPTQVPETSGDFSYPLRKSTVAITVKLWQVILEAIRMFTRTDNTFYERPYLLIQQKTASRKGANLHYRLETVDDDGDTLIVAVDGNSVRISKISATDKTDRSPLPAFTAQTSAQLTAVMLSLLPIILDIDTHNANGKLGAVVSQLGAELEDAANWTDENDIPSMVKDHLYFTDAVISILDTIFLDFGDSQSVEPEEADIPSFHQDVKVRGSVLCANYNNGWEPRFLESDGTKAAMAGAVITVGMAKQAFSAYTAGRNWSLVETMMIPHFPDNMPVPEETMMMANWICNTSNDTNPARTGMWRSDTGHGKSTGVEILACILHIPLLKMTCHPNMEAGDFKSSFVPATDSEDGVPLDTTNAVVPVAEEAAADRPPFFDAAMAYVAAMDVQARDTLFEPKRFYAEAAFADPEELAASLLGHKQAVSYEELCWLYSEVRSATMREQPLRQKIKQLSASVKSSEGNKEKGGNKPEFVHVVSNYITAMVNGYLCEIQEPSRIRDSGVLVSLNEFDRPGAVIPLMNGGKARRHKDAICIFTDNVGYGSCRPIDPSVLRRMAFIIDSTELSKEKLLARVVWNTKCDDKDLLETAYSYWRACKDYCEQNSITEGSTSPMELERLVQGLMHDGPDSLEIHLDNCVISKATSDTEDQKGIRTACMTAVAGF